MSGLLTIVVVVLVRMVVVVLEEEGKVGSPRLLLQAQLGSAHTLLPIPPSCQPAVHTFVSIEISLMAPFKSQKLD